MGDWQRQLEGMTPNDNPLAWVPVDQVTTRDRLAYRRLARVGRLLTEGLEVGLRRAVLSMADFNAAMERAHVIMRRSCSKITP